MANQFISDIKKSFINIGCANQIIFIITNYVLISCVDNYGYVLQPKRRGLAGVSRQI